MPGIDKEKLDDMKVSIKAIVEAIERILKKVNIDCEHCKYKDWFACNICILNTEGLLFEEKET
ncbi:MAG: hypothetical protein DRI44_02565 [Chlamydiae bacterium]|nr:MAG: hypothetical protein DRI44_02565 [Chlamydiota bacterium]